MLNKSGLLFIGLAVLTVLAGCGSKMPDDSAVQSRPQSSLVLSSASETPSQAAESSAAESATPPAPSSAASLKSGGALSVHMVSAEYKKNGTDIKANYPQFDGQGCAGANAAIAKEALSTIENIKRNPEDGITADTSGRVKFSSENFVSVEFETNFMAKGAAHPSSTIRTVNFDMKTDKALTVKDMVVNNAALQNAMDAAVKQQLSKELREYLTPQVLRDSLGQSQVYFTKDSMVLSFEVIFTLGDHAEISIPYAKTNGFRTDSSVWNDLVKS